MDEKVAENSGRTTVDGVSFFGNREDLDTSKCAGGIEAVAEKDAGLWSCKVVSLDLRKVLQLPSALFGIALSQNRIYWGDGSEIKLKSSTKDGEDIQTL